MTDQELEKKIYELISYESGVPIESLHRDIDFVNDLDVTVLVELVMSLEDEDEGGGIVKSKFNDGEVEEKVKTVGDFIDLVKLMKCRE